jgi:dCTP diphosphatase
MDEIIRFVLGGINLWAPAVTVVCGTVAAVRADATGAGTAHTGPTRAGITRRLWCDFTLAAVLGFLVWFGCDGIGHVWSLLAQGDTAEFNTGSILYTDLLLPVAGVLLYIGAGGADQGVSHAARPAARPPTDPAVPDPSTYRGATGIEALQHAVLKFAQERDWQQFHDPKNLSMAVAVEAGELMEHFRWVRSDESRVVLADARTREAVEQEVADVMMLLLEFAASTDIDVSRAVEAKLAINAQRYPVDKCHGRATKYDRLDEAR